MVPAAHRRRETAVVQIHLAHQISAPVEQVFDWLADPANLAVAPLVVKSDWVAGTPGPGVGAVREVTGVGTWFREEITAYDRPHSYTYLILRSFPPFRHDGGTLTFTPSGSGTTVDWLTNYTHPAVAGGKALEAVSRRLLRWSFTSILEGCAKALGGQAVERR
jgi:uncharacterized protein YndB with AHSA1/START domain